MPTARFEADFSGFIAAINASQIALVDFNKGAETVQTTLNKMTDQFSGRAIIQEASLMVIAVEKLGGVSALTADELQTVGAKAQEAADKLRAMGSDVPAAIQKYADAAKDAGGATTDWSSAVSTLGGVLGAIGISASITGIVNFVKDIANGAAEIENLAKRMQTSASEVQRFQTIADQTGVSVGTMASAMERLSERVGNGDTGAIAQLDKLGISVNQFKDQTTYQNFVQIAEGLAKITDREQENVAGTELLGRAYKTLLPAISASIDDVGHSTQQMTGATTQFWEDSKNAASRFWTEFKAGFANAHNEIWNVNKDIDEFKAALATIPQPKLPVPDPIKWGDAKVAIVDTAAASKDLTDQINAQQKAFKDHQTAVDNINAAMKGYEATLAAIDPQLVATVEHELALGAQARDVATAHNLTKIQIDAVVASMKELDAQAKADAQSEEDYQNQVLQGADKLKAAQAAYNDYLAKTTEDTTTYQINKLWEKVDQEEKSFEGSEAQRAEYNKVVEALADAQTDAIVAAAYKAEDGTKEALDQTVTDYKEASEKIQQYKLTPASQGASAAMSDALAEVDASNIGQMMKMGTTSVAMMNQYEAAIEAAMAQRGYSVGGGLTPAAQNAGYGAGGITTTVNVNGSVLSTPAQLSTAVSAALADAMRRAGISLPSQ